MTAVTVGDATKAEPTAVRERVHAAVRHREDGRAMMVATARVVLDNTSLAVKVFGVNYFCR